MSPIHNFFLLLGVTIFTGCSTEPNPVKLENEIVRLKARFIDGKFLVSLVNLETKNRVNSVPITLINTATGDKHLYTHPIYDPSRDSFMAVSGVKYIIECTYKGETFRDSLTYQVIDPDKVRFSTGFEEINGGTIAFFQTHGLDQYADLVINYSPCTYISNTVEATYPIAFSCSEYRVKDQIRNPVNTFCELPVKTENLERRLFYTDERSAEMIKRQEKNSAITEFEALYSSNANLVDMSLNKKIIGQFYYVNTLPFTVTLEDRSVTRHSVKIIDKKTNQDITTLSTDLKWDEEWPADLRITHNEWDALRYERDMQCQIRDRFPFRKSVSAELTLTYQGIEMSGILSMPLDAKEKELKVYVEQ